ncbi:MAG TPA: hypothetical protein VMH90_02435 [Thermoplasmata archaeon]|nr:hypothetical protein [Thermoplasmata archaeon]
MPPTALDADPAPGGLSAWWAHHAHRYLLPILGGTALTAGASAALLGPVHPAVPPAGMLMILGASAVSASMLSTALRLRLESDWARAAPRPPPPAASPKCPACAEPAESHHAAHDLLRQIEIWNHLRRRGASAAFASTTGATPSDFIWSSWAPAATALPVALVGPVPETAYIPPAPGTVDRFPEHGVPMELPAAWAGPPLGPHRVPADPPAVGPGAPEGPQLPEPSRPGPTLPLDGRLGRSAAYAGPFVSPPPGAPGPGAGAPDAALLELPEELDWIQREALTALPPHLRPPPAARSASPARTAPPAPPPPRADASPTTLYCATCAERIPNPAVWRRCPDCFRPICPECIVTALLEQDRGWCEQCAAARIGTDLEVGN